MNLETKTKIRSLPCVQIFLSSSWERVQNSQSSTCTIPWIFQVLRMSFIAIRKSTLNAFWQKSFWSMDDFTSITDFFAGSPNTWSSSTNLRHWLWITTKVAATTLSIILRMPFSPSISTITSQSWQSRVIGRNICSTSCRSSFYLLEGRWNGLSSVSNVLTQRSRESRIWMKLLRTNLGK